MGKPSFGEQAIGPGGVSKWTPESGNLGDNQEIMEGGSQKAKDVCSIPHPSIQPAFLSMSLCQELDSPPFRMASL